MKKTGRRINQVLEPSKKLLKYPDKKTTLILNESEKIEIENEYFLILGRKNFSYQEQVIDKKDVSQIISLGNAAINNEVIQHCLDEEVVIIFLDSEGSFRGKLSKPIDLQINVSDAKSIWLAQCFAYGAVKNLRAWFLRMLRSKQLKKEPEGIRLHLKRMLDLQQELLYYERQSIDEVRGAIGEAYKDLFSTWLHYFIFNGKWEWKENESPLSLLINYSHNLLIEQAKSALILNGINPIYGTVNSSLRRCGLAIDLTLEYRPWIYSLITRLINRRQLSLKDFDDWYVGKKTPLRVTQAIVAEYRKKINERKKLFDSEVAITYSESFDIQAQQIKIYLEGKHDEYAPIHYN